MNDKRLATAFAWAMILLVSDLPDVVIFLFYALTWVPR